VGRNFYPHTHTNGDPHGDPDTHGRPGTPVRSTPHRAPPYLSEHCIPVSSADTRRHLRSANRHLGYLPYRVSGSTLRPSGVLSCWPGTLSRTLSRIQRAAQIVLGVYLKRTCSRDRIIGLLVHPAHYGPITIAIRARFEYDSTTIRLRFGYNTLQHATRFFVRSHTRSYTRISGRRVLHVD